AFLLGVLDQGARNAVLDRARGVVRLELGPQVHARLGRQPRQLDQRRVPDRLDDVAIPAPAGAVPQPLRRHYFTEYSDLAEARWGGAHAIPEPRAPRAARGALCRKRRARRAARSHMVG